MEITLIPVKQIFYNPDNDYRILSCVPQDWNTNIQLNKYGNFTISGSNLMSIILNQAVSLDIECDNNSKYPASYVVNGYAGVSFVGDIKVDPNHELLLLQQIMTKDQAKNVNKAYPNFVELVLNNRESEIDFKKIYNVGDFRFADYCNKIKENFGVFLFFSKTKTYNITDFSVISKLYFSYKNPDIWEEHYVKNPYTILSTYTDWTFNKIDKTVLSSMPDFISSKERATYCIYNILHENENEGDTKIDARVLKTVIVEDYPDIVNHVTTVVKEDVNIYYDSTTKNCSLRLTYEAEKNIADNILARVNNPIPDTMDWHKYKNIDNYQMTDEQNAICRIANDKSIGMMIGCAGSGKTTATQALIKMLDDYGKSYLLLAPTGIAAKRLRESSHRPASTIHMALTRNAFEEKYDYIIIDEMSCVGVHLLSTVFSLIPLSTKIIFICDNAQLASISCGNIVDDIINADIVPTTELTKIFRYGTSGIATVATNTRNGVSTKDNDSFNDNDYKFVNINNSPLNQIVEEYNNLLLDGYSKNDILILCPYNKSNLGTYTINEAIQKEFNSNPNFITFAVKGKPVKEIKFCVGDRVMNTKNNYKAIVTEIDETGEYYISDKTTSIMNGDIGVIRSIDLNKDTGKFNMYIQFDEQLICYDNKTTTNLLLGYAISVHKSQGTQAKAIISVIGKNHKNMVTRNLLYVAVSRAQNKLVEIVDKDAVEAGLNKVETIDRYTWLFDLLSNLMPNN